MPVRKYKVLSGARETTRTASSSLPDLEFKYNPFGLRILKIEKTKSSPGFYAPAEEWNYTYYTYDANGQTMAVYDLEISETNNQARMEEHHLYGASRLGMLKEGELIFDNGPMAPVTSDVYQNELGDRRYELTNHLGNVQAVITDRRIWNATDVNYEAVVVMTSDYYPFGMQMPNPDRIVGDYRYAYNGMEVDNEVSGNGNSYTTEFRQYDPRLGRWKSLDPLMAMFPNQSAYCAFDNNPIYYVDPKGLSANGKGDKLTRKEKKLAKEAGLAYIGDDKVIGKVKYSRGTDGTVEYSYRKEDEDGGNSRVQFRVQGVLEEQGVAGVNSEYVGDLEFKWDGSKKGFFLGNQNLDDLTTVEAAFLEDGAYERACKGGTLTVFGYDLTFEDSDPSSGNVERRIDNLSWNWYRYGVIKEYYKNDIEGLKAAAQARIFLGAIGGSEATGILSGSQRIIGVLANAKKISGRFPREGGPIWGTLYRSNNKGVTSYAKYDGSGMIIKRVDVTGKAHNGVPTPHVLEYGRNVLPDGTIKVNTPKKSPVRPANAWEKL